MVPGFTFGGQKFGSTLAVPIRVSKGFLEKALVRRKMRIVDSGIHGARYRGSKAYGRLRL